MPKNNSIVFENDKFKLTLLDNAVAESLILKSSNLECIYQEDKLPFFSITEERPYNNEVKLAHPNKRTTFLANHVRMEDGKLIVGFEMIDFEAVIDVKIASNYIAFKLVDFVVRPDSFGIGVLPILPPVSEFRLIQLPIPHKERFGEWLNVMWDDKVAINVLACSPYSRISSEKRKDYRVLLGETLQDVSLKNEPVALIVSDPKEILDAVESVENDYDLPRGVESRRSPLLNRSYYRTCEINPSNVDEHIEIARKGGFKFILIYYSAIFAESGAYYKSGEYDKFRPEYPNGMDDVITVLNKIKAAGIIPGLHILHTHIGFKTKYLTPVADHRLNLVRRFTLSQPASANDTTLYVEETPIGSPICEEQRVLKFMGELIQYESFTTEHPYCFTGCKRGFNDTRVRDFEVGTPGGILDVSEFAGHSTYIDQRTSLQDDVADDIARLYNAGFEFVYFDGSEGTNPPFDINVGLAQWRVYKKFNKKPIFCEGAAKSHFSWHIINGGNAFDAWKPQNFKEMIVKHPFKAAPNMANDFTRLNFGWWIFFNDLRPDIIEYGTALAAACDCPGAFLIYLQTMRNHPRTADILETLRRWEKARESGFLTSEIKARLKNTEQEHTLLINESGELEIAKYEQVTLSDDTITAFVFERLGKSYAVCWHNSGSATLKIPLTSDNISYVSKLGGEEIAITKEQEYITIPVDGKRYLITDAPLSTLKDAIANSSLL